VRWQPGGSPDDYFFDEVPGWTVANALSRLLTKVRNNPNRTITIQKFIKDSCKGNLKTYFETVREGMGRGDSVVMAEVAYKSFIQLTTGDKPLLRVFAPKTKPRTRAAAVSEEGYAYKDYIVQVTEHGFELMRVKPVYEDAGSPPRKQRKLTHDPVSGLLSPADGSSKYTTPLSFIPMISEQEQEVATNMMLYFKASFDGLLATIVHIRNENQNYQRENMALSLANTDLSKEYDMYKHQLIQLTHFQHLSPENTQQDLQHQQQQEIMQYQQLQLHQQQLQLQQQQLQQLQQQQQQPQQLQDHTLQQQLMEQQAQFQQQLSQGLLQPTQQ